ncbi:hypothetical protein K449DRAFT_210689 [Hypoxylon sp. EC38]|nr:hypothetical protein K449DRAFT_210689 [Hypoxylon sp. EC38]
MRWEPDKSHPGGCYARCAFSAQEEDNTNRLRGHPAAPAALTWIIIPKMAIFSPLFSLLGEWVPQLSLSFRHPDVATVRPIHIRLTGTSNISRIHTCMGDTQPNNVTGSLPGYLAYPSSHPTDLEKRGFVGLSDPKPLNSLFPFPPFPLHLLWTVFSYFFMRFLQIACWEHDGITISGCMQDTGTRGLKRRDTRHLWTLHVNCPALGLRPAGEAE